MNERFSRRAFLKSVGASAAMLPLLEAEPAIAAPLDGFPKRLVTVAWTNGVVAADFYPASGTALTLGQTLQPLAPFVSKMLMPIGLDQTVVLDAAGGRQYDGHFTFPSLLTGTAQQVSEGRIGQSISVDQFISDNIAKTVTLPVPLLNLGVRSQGDGNPTSWRAAGQMNKADTDPNHVFTRLFAGAVTPVDQLAALRNRRKSVLDFLGNDLTAFSQRLGTDDKIKIQSHMDSIRAIEMQLDQMMPPPGGAMCMQPTIPAGAAKLDVPSLMKMMFDLGAVALKCDLTRVITYDLYDDGGGDGNNFPWINVTSDYHKVAHAGAAQAADKIKIDQWIFTQVANLATQLDATMEAGGTALDHTVIMTMNDMDEGANHYVGKIPFLLIGSCGGYFKTGRVVRYSKIPHNRLLATLCNAMGVPVTSFGAPAYSGTLPELLM
jgi:hypothetical protein